MLPSDIASAPATPKKPKAKPQTSTGPKAPVAAPSTGAPVSTLQPPLTVAAATARAAADSAGANPPQADLSLKTVAQELFAPSSEKASTELSQAALSPIQLALQQQDAAAPLDLSVKGSGVEAMLSAYKAPAYLTEEQEDEQRAEVDRGDRRARRETALEAGSENKARRIRNQIRTTSEGDYRDMSPEQRAAFDFNRMLVAAVRKDSNRVDDSLIGGKHADKYQPSAEQREKYDKAIEEIFGEGQGSDIFAPETVGLLRQIGYRDDAADLDDFLSLNAAIGRKQIERMAPDRITLENEHTGPLAPGTNPAPGLNPITATENQREKFDLAKELAHNTQAIEAAVANSQPLQQQITQVFQTERNEDVESLGGKATKVTPALGYGSAKYDANGVPEDVNSYFQLAFEQIAGKKTDPKTVLADANAMLSPEEFSQFRSYMANRALNAQRYKIPLGADPKAKYMTPEQFIKLLDLDKPGGE